MIFFSSILEIITLNVFGNFTKLQGVQIILCHNCSLKLKVVFVTSLGLKLNLKLNFTCTFHLDEFSVKRASITLNSKYLLIHLIAFTILLLYRRILDQLIFLFLLDGGFSPKYYLIRRSAIAEAPLILLILEYVDDSFRGLLA